MPHRDQSAIDALKFVHPDDYSKVVREHVLNLTLDERREMVHGFILNCSALMLDIDNELEAEERAILTTYTVHLYMACFQELYTNAEEHLEKATALNKLLDKS